MPVTAAAGALLAFGEEFSRQAFYSMLQRSGVEKVRICVSCQDAMITLNQSAKKWNLLLLDNRIARGLDTVREIRRRMGPHIKIMMVFSGPTKEAVAEAIEAGVDDIMIYPVSQATLEKKLARHVSVQPARVTLFKRADQSADVFMARP